jgi:diguanylate cyclase (GGDEF)-like protein
LKANTRRLVWIPVSAALVVLVSVIDYLSGPDLTFSLFYLAVMVLFAWKVAGVRESVLAAIVVAVVWLAVEWFSQGAPHQAILLLNALMRLIILAGLAVLVCQLQGALAAEKSLARTDYLTGALNVRAFAERAKREISRSQRYGHPLTVAYIDIDDFKIVNDRFGHSYGDKVLRAVSDCLKSNLRESDCLSRVGGDEFVVLLPETGLDQGQHVLDKFRSVVSNTALARESFVTFSIGAVVFDPPPSDVDELIRAADAVMYESKLDGKDRISLIVAERDGERRKSESAIERRSN